MRKTVQIKITVSEEDAQKIKETAEGMGISISSYLTMQGLIGWYNLKKIKEE